MRKNFFKCLNCIILLVVMCCVCLTGCNLFERDNAKYLAQVVANVKGPHATSVTMEDLLNGYSSWGYQYFQSQNVDKEEATKQIINDIIDRKYLLQYFEDQKFELDEKEEWKALKDTYDSINSQISDLEDTIKIEWKWTNASGDNSDDESTNNKDKIYTPYDSKFDVDENGNIAFKDVEEEEVSYPNEKPTFVYTSIGAQENADKDNKRLFEEAKSRYFSNLKDAYKNRGITKKSDDELFELEVKRIEKNYLENAKITKLQEYYEDNVANTKNALDEVLDAVYNEFKNQYLAQKQLYSNSNNIDKYRKDILNSSRSNAFYYNPVETSGEFFTVTHVLLKFSDEVQAELDEAKKLAESDGGTKENYQNLLRSKYQTIKVQAVNPKTGIAEGEYYTPQDILLEINRATSAGKINLETFRDIQFKYQGDTAVYTSTYDYVIPMDESKDTMVKNFANTSRELRGNGSVDNIGKVSGLVESEYGYHIIVYTGEVTNVVSSVENKDAVLKQLINTRLKADRNKTYFDLVYESISSKITTFNTWSENIVKTYRNGIEIKWYPYRYKKLYE